MRSEQEHIDDFFRKKEEEYQQDTGQADAHWEQMRGLLKPAIGPDPVPKGYRLATTRRIIQYLGGFTVVTVITLVTLTAIRSKKKATTKSLAQKTMIAPAKKQLAARTTTDRKDTLIRPARKALHVIAPKTATNPNPVTKAAIPVNAAPVKPASRRFSDEKPVAPAIQPKVEKAPPLPVQTLGNPVSIVPGTPDLALGSAQQTIRSEVLELKSTEADLTLSNFITPSSPAAQVNAFYQQLQKPGEQFVIEVDKDTILTGKEGTRLSIPAFAFAGKNGLIKEGLVTIVLREYYTYDDILAAKLSTTAGGEQLISGGMVHLAAQVNGDPVNIAGRKNIRLEMPTAKPDEQMQLFRGTRSSLKKAFVAKFMDNRMIDTVRYMKREADENGDIDWIPEGQEQKFSDPLNRRILVLDPYADPYHVSHGKRIKAYFYVAKACPYSDAEMRDKLRAYSNNYFEVIKIKRVNAVPMANYKTREDRVSIAGDSVVMTFRQAMRRKLLTPEDSIKVLEKFRTDSLNLDNRHQLMDKYSFTITNLGWYNCDKFNNNVPKVLFAFNPGEGFDPGSMVSHIVFTRYKSVMAGAYKDNKIQFGRVPKNESVKIVCIGIKNGKVLACIQELNTDREEIGNLAFEETTPAAFKQKLQSLRLSLP